MNYNMDLVKVSLVSPKVYLGNVDKNHLEIQKHINELCDEGSDIIVFPEMALCGYTCADLLFQNSLIERCSNAVGDLAGSQFGSIVIVGSPFYINSKVYNCAVVIQGEKILGIVPKTYLPTYGEFYEKRWFDSPGPEVEEWCGIPVGNSLVFKVNQDLSFCIDVCEDLWAPIPPSTNGCLNGANLVFNLSASNELVGKHQYRKGLVAQQSGKLNCTYAYVSAGVGESTTDTVYLANHIIAQNGSLLIEKQSEDAMITTQIIDYGLLNSERKKNTTFRQSCSFVKKATVINVDCDYLSYENDPEDYPKLSKTPFVPKVMDERYRSITKIQSVALKRRLQHINCKDVVIGVSGGLDSTLSLLVAVEAFNELSIQLSGIHAISMPCFGTTNKTRENAKLLSLSLGLDFREIDISDAVTRHMLLLGIDKTKYDVTYENCQARERTQVLMDLSSYYKGIVLGTGDMSEMAIGFCTYNGDHMSMYNVNCGVPKTLVKHLVSGYMNDFSKNGSETVAGLLNSIVNTEISPELLPPDKQGNISQKTEEIVGPYELIDFFLFYTMRYDFSDEKVVALAVKAFEDDHDEDKIEKWFKMFKKRFYANQFKRSCVPDGPKIGSVALSPRADWRMPSDAVL